MKIKGFLVFLLLLFTIHSTWSLERIIIKETKDQYTGNFVLLNPKKIIFLLFNQRFEFTQEEIEYINFEDSDAQLEILLDDNSVLKGMIVDQDDDFFTIGSSAGLTTIDKVRIVEIKNPEFEEFYEKEVEEVQAIALHLGIEPAGSLVLNDFGNSYQPYGSLALYFETDFGFPVFFGIDLHAFLNISQFGNTEDFLLVIPVHLYLKYQGKLGGIEQLLWSVKSGIGCASLIFMETGDGNTSYDIAFCQITDLGLKYKLSGNLYLGINAKANLVVQQSSYIFTQSIGLVVEFGL